MTIAEALKNVWRTLDIADGGIRYSGDIAKALVAGALFGHDRQPARRYRGVTRRGRVVPGSILQILSRHGIHRRDG